MIKHFNRISLAVGVPGLLIQTLASIHHWPPNQQVVGTTLVLLGTGLLIVGLSYYAKARGHHLAWGVLGLVSIIGAIILGLMLDNAKVTTKATT